MAIQIKTFFDKNTFTLTYIVYDNDSRDAVVIDPVLDFDSASGRIWFDSVNQVLGYVEQEKLNVHAILETHAHADHLSGAKMIQTKSIQKKIKKAKIAIGARISMVQSTFKTIFNMTELAVDGSQFDHLLNDNEIYRAGQLSIKTIFTPGHTPACVSYLIGTNLFVGDSIFMPDSGTGRCDFPQGSADSLYHSIKERIYTLPDSTHIYVGHDYQPNGRELKYQTTVLEQKQSNIHVTATTEKEKFIGFRSERDKTLSAPKLLLPSLQININAGELPRPESNGQIYLKLPINIKG